MSMLRYWRQIDRPVPLRLLVSARTPGDLFYSGEYGAETTLVFTRAAPEGFSRAPGRVDAADLKPLLDAAAAEPGTVAYVCGSAGFAEYASQLLVSLGFDTGSIRIERFGPA
jgi:ferredoxin-NADP reductase